MAKNQKGPSYNGSWLEGPFPSLKLGEPSSPHRKEIWAMFHTESHREVLSTSGNLGR